MPTTPHSPAFDTHDAVSPDEAERRLRRELDALPALPPEDDLLDSRDALEPEPTADIPDALLYKPRKMQITVRVDADVLAWLQAQGRGYQTRLNAILRRAMLEDKGRPARHGDRSDRGEQGGQQG